MQNNPIRYNDPTGHRPCGLDDNNCENIIRLEKFIVQVEKEFDPITGSLPDDYKYEDSIISETDSLIKKLYFEHGINWHELARNLENNPITSEDLLEWDAPLAEIYGRIYHLNSKHVPYGLFLNELGLESNSDTYFMNYDSNYLAALMANHPKALDAAKRKYLIHISRNDKNLWIDLFGDQGPLWSPGGD